MSNTANEVESNLHGGPSESESSRKRKAYLIKQKLETIDYANKFSKHSAVKKFNVSRRSVMDWCEQEASLRQQQISNATDGSQDHLIHCFKEDGPVPSGRAKLQQAREDKELAQLLEEIDLTEEENVEYDSDLSLE